MNGCEVKRCKHYRDGKCAYAGPVCIFQDYDAPDPASDDADLLRLILEESGSYLQTRTREQVEARLVSLGHTLPPPPSRAFAVHDVFRPILDQIAPKATKP